MTIEVSYAPAEAAGVADAGCLGVIGFGAERPPALPGDLPFLALPLRPLGAPSLEIWRAGGPVTRIDQDGIALARSGGWLFGVLRVAAAGQRDLEGLARTTYGRVFAAAEAAGCPHLLRVFHYFPRVTAIEGGRPRYHAFNTGRHAAFVAAGRTMTAAPAASALGIAGGTGDGDALWLYFLAGAAPGLAIENARQISAYRYPAEHGPHGPMFSRAMIAGTGRDALLFVSGTASIVDHRSRHPGDVAAQTDEVLRNLAALRDECARRGFVAPGAWRLKAYLRHPADATLVAERLARAPFAVAPEPLFLHAEVCREDLLVEIEAACRLSAT